MMRLYINRKILLGLFATILIILVLGLASFWYSQQVIDASRLGGQSQMLVLCLEQVRSLAITIEAAQLKNAGTASDESAHKSFEESVISIKGRIKELDSLNVPGSIQRQQVEQLHSLIEKKINIVRRSFEAKAFKENEPDSFLIEMGNLIDNIQRQENVLKRERATSLTHQFLRFGLSFFGLLATGMIILFVLIYSLNTNMKARFKAEEKLKQASKSVHDLYENAPCGYFSIDQQGMFTGINQTLLGWLGYSRENVVHRLHITEIISNGASLLDERESVEYKENGFFRDLEATVVRQDKTIFPAIINAVALVGPNGRYLGSRCTLFDNTERKKAEDNAKQLAKELEAFSYSVSHDLRTPLRSINGYTQILKEDYSSQLDDEGVQVLNRVIRNSLRMGNLIDDLLLFSHTNRKDITREMTNMTEFVTQITNDIMDGENGRQIKISIGDLGTAQVDKSMFRQAWINLLSNAIKYTSTRKTALINLWSVDKPEGTVYAISDNGVGFNMKYYHKLFGVFNRLHKQEEFEGTGVGLALVQRIIERHNGRIWAEAKEDEGATFYFTIPKT